MEKQLESKYNSFTTNKGNLIWVGTMCLAWKNLADFNQVQQLQLNTNQPHAINTINNFNHSPFSSKHIDQKSIYVKTGRGPAVQDLINKEVKQKFPNYSFPDLAYQLQPKSILAFAYLYKQLTFKTQFQRREDNSFTFNGQKVPSFFAADDDQREQVAVCSYKDDENFCVRIPGMQCIDYLYLAKSSIQLSVDEVIQQVAVIEKQPAYPMSQGDSFEMPLIDFDCKRQFKEMFGLPFSNSQAKGQVMSAMCEALKLKVDESGVKVESCAYIVINQCSFGPVVPKLLMLDKSFWMVMKEIGKHPYLCVRVVNPDDK